MIKIIIHCNSENTQDYTIQVVENEKTTQDIHITPDYPPHSGELLSLLSLLQNVKHYTIETKEF